MKSSADRTKKLARLLKSLPSITPTPFPDANDPVAVLVQSWLIWETTTARAIPAYQALRERFVDFNELRVSMSDEIVDALPSRYPAAVERAERMRATLRAIYLREHAVSLEAVRDQGKRDARKYVESLEGVVPYVSARLVLLAFGTHVLPVDNALLTRLLEEDVVEEGATDSDASGVLTRAVKAGDGEAVHASLQAWVEAGGGGTAGTKKKRSASGSTTTTAKASTTRRTPAARGRGKSGEAG